MTNSAHRIIFTPALPNSLPTPIVAGIWRRLRSRPGHEIPPPIERCSKKVCPAISAEKLRLLFIAIAACESWISNSRQDQAVKEQKAIARKMDDFDAPDGERQRQYMLTEKCAKRIQAILLYSYIRATGAKMPGKQHLLFSAHILLRASNPRRRAFRVEEFRKVAGKLRGRFRTMLKDHPAKECIKAAENVIGQLESLLHFAPRRRMLAEVEVTEPPVDSTEPAPDCGADEFQ